jgi:hypothetical protein
MIYILGPTFTVVVCALSATIGYLYRERMLRILVAICPPSVLAKFKEEDQLDVPPRVPRVTAELPSDSDDDEAAAMGLGQGGDDPHAPKKRKRKKKADRKQERREYRGTFLFTVFVDRARHLPRLDHPIRDPHLLGSSGAPPPPPPPPAADAPKGARSTHSSSMPPSIRISSSCRIMLKRRIGSSAWRRAVRTWAQMLRIVKDDHAWNGASHHFL